MKSIKLTVISLVAMFSLGMTFVVAPGASAQSPILDCRDSALAASDLCKEFLDNSDGGRIFGPDSLISRVVETIIFVSGSIAVLMIVIGGLRYAISNGDPQGIANAKNTIIYAIVGLVIALMAEAILRFVLQRL